MSWRLKGFRVKRTPPMTNNLLPVWAYIAAGWL
jgi:hypothetical protein